MRHDAEYRTLIVTSGIDPDELPVLAQQLASAFGLDEAKVARLLSGRPPLTIVLPSRQAQVVATFLRDAGVKVELTSERTGGRRRWPWALAGIGIGVAVAFAIWPALEPHVSAFTAERVAQVTTGDNPRVEESDLFDAARRGDLNAVRRQIMLGADLNSRDEYGQTPLIYAVDHGRDGVVNVLLVSGADPNARTRTGWTPLMYAARDGRPARVAELLLAAGADPSLRNDAGQTALEIARASDNRAVMDVLVQAEEMGAAAVAPIAESPGSEAARHVDVPAERVNGVTSVNEVEEVPVAVRQERSEPVALSARPAAGGSARAGSQSHSKNDENDDENRQFIIDCLEDWESCGQY